MVTEKTSPTEIKIVFGIEEPVDQFYKFIFYLQPHWEKYQTQLKEGDIATTTSFAQHLDL